MERRQWLPHGLLRQGCERNHHHRNRPPKALLLRHARQQPGHRQRGGQLRADLGGVFERNYS